MTPLYLGVCLSVKFAFDGDGEITQNPHAWRFILDTQNHLDKLPASRAITVGLHV